ncbi:MAG TPA: Hsp70 family protein [Edaphobacter sp.]
MLQQSPAIGIDFGTTNSSLAMVREDGRVELATFSFQGAATQSFRSVLYLEQVRRAGGAKQITSKTGPAAIEAYLEAEEKGRLVQSLKSYLPNRNLTGTEVFGRRYTLEELVSRMLADLRTHAEKEFGVPVRRATAGRPVRFVGSDGEEDDAYAESRLREAFLQAGFESVEFEMEPVGAAYAYESSLDHDELILIGDFGGGTSDFSLLHVGPGVRQRGHGLQDLLGNSGVGLAGDAFDARIVRKLVSPALGSDSLARSLNKTLPAVPAWIYTNLERWHYLSFLRTRNVSEILKSARLRALEPEKIEALTTLIEEDLGYQLHQAVQRVKFELSRAEAAEFRFREGGLDLRIPVTRAEFEGWIADELALIEECVDSLLADTGVKPEKVNRVFLTGGTSLVPAVRRIFASRFGEERIRTGNEFTSVAHGLALRAAESSVGRG